MSACKTGCGRPVARGPEDWLCEYCRFEWEGSAERVRFHDVETEAREMVAMTDFCSRVRAERINGRPRA